MKLAGLIEMFRSHILNLPITVHHLHCLISGQISSLFYLSDNIVELCRIAWIFWNNILDILVTAQDRRPRHHLHYSISGQISLLFYHSDKISELELGRIAWIFFSSSLTPQLEAQVLHTPVRSAHCVAGLGLLLLVSRQLTMAAACLVKLTSSSWIPQPHATSARAQAPRPWQGCCQAAVNKPASAFVWVGSMYDPVPESLASKPAGPGRRAIESGTQSTYSARTSMYTVLCTV